MKASDIKIIKWYQVVAAYFISIAWTAMVLYVLNCINIWICGVGIFK